MANTNDTADVPENTSLGNSGSITGVQSSVETTDYVAGWTQEKPGIWARFGSWIIAGVILLGIGGFLLFQQVTTPPIAVNPTDTPIVFTIGDKEFQVSAGGFAKLDISPGNHTVSMDGEVLGTFNYGWLDGDSIINPTLSPFVEVEILYTNNPTAHSSKLSNNTIEIYDETVEWPYRLIDPVLYLKKTWDYDQFNNKSPMEISIKWDYAIKKELFSIDGFVDAYNAGKI